MLHSYIVELKYAKSKDTDAHVQQLREDCSSLYLVDYLAPYA